MSFIVDKIKAVFATKELTPDERWKKLSQRCSRDITIKKIAAEALKYLSIGSSLVCATVPFMVLSLATGGLGLVLGAGIIAVAGVSASILGIFKSEELKKYFDFTDYSSQTTVRDDILKIKQRSLSELAFHLNSPVYRIDNLRRYGVISSKSADRMQLIFLNYIKFRDNCKNLAYENLSNDSEKARLKEIKQEWKQFQSTIDNDLPKQFD